MNTEHQTTPEERAFERLLDEAFEKLPEAAHIILQEAHEFPHGFYMVSGYGGDDLQKHEEAVEEMHAVGADLTDPECELLTKCWLGALSAAASVDPYDYETLTGHKVYRAHLHKHYRMFSSIVEEVVTKRKLAGSVQSSDRHSQRFPDGGSGASNAGTPV